MCPATPSPPLHTVKIAEIRERITSSTGAIVESNARFDSSELRTFEAGGQYSPENVATYRVSLAAIDSHTMAAQAAQQAQLEAASAALSSKVRCMSWFRVCSCAKRHDMPDLQTLPLVCSLHLAFLALGFGNYKSGATVQQGTVHLDGLSCPHSGVAWCSLRA